MESKKHFGPFWSTIAIQISAQAFYTKYSLTLLRYIQILYHLHFDDMKLSFKLGRLNLTLSPVAAAFADTIEQKIVFDQSSVKKPIVWKAYVSSQCRQSSSHISMELCLTMLNRDEICSAILGGLLLWLSSYLENRNFILEGQRRTLLHYSTPNYQVSGFICAKDIS